MTTLTEQWKQGKLPFGWYYIKIADIVFIDFFEGKVWKNKKDKYIDEVLAEVPSYEQWQKHRKTLLKTQKKNCDLEIINEQLKEYERIVASYYMKPIDYETSCETVNKLLDEKKGLKQENTKLKELLKECEHMIIAYSINNNTFTKEEIKNIISKIDQVLGE